MEAIILMLVGVVYFFLVDYTIGAIGIDSRLLQYSITFGGLFILLYLEKRWKRK